MILKIALIALVTLIIQGCSGKPYPVDRPFEVVVTEKCKPPRPIGCDLSFQDTYTKKIDQMDFCIRELFGIVNFCSSGENIESKTPD